LTLCGALLRYTKRGDASDHERFFAAKEKWDAEL
jgi:hypothetical protein